MIVAIIIIGLAFIWLGHETKWLTVRLLRDAFSVGGILMMGLAMVFLAIGFAFLPLKKRCDRAESPIPTSIYNRLVWIKTASGKTKRQVPYYAAVKIRQRLGGDIITKLI